VFVHISLIKRKVSKLTKQVKKILNGKLFNPLLVFHILTILNTIDSLGKFDGKSDEGYLLGYCTNSKGFRVYNKATKKVQECLHVDFLEDQKSQKGKSPDWMFDLDILTPSMNYVPVREENQVVHKEEDSQ
jgi:hypothetical protein